MTTDTPAVARGRTRAVLRRRDYRLFLGSYATSRVGDYLYLVGLAAYVYERTGSAAWVSAAALARFIPYTVLSAPAGVIADRHERRLVMATGDLVQLAAMTALTVTAALSGPAAAVIALSAVSAAAATLYTASASAMVSSIVPEDELAPANSLVSTVGELAFIAGPGAGGLLLFLGSPAWAFGINAATFAVSAALLLAMRVRSHPKPSTERAGALREMREGIGAFVGNPTVAVLVGCLVAGTIVYGVELVVLVLVSSQLLGTGTQGLGWLLACSGIGGAIGATLSPRLAGVRRARLTIAVLVLLTGIPLASLSVIRVPAGAYAVLVVEGVAIVALDVLVDTAMQRGIAAEVLGRVSGLALTLTAVGTALGTLVAPVLVRAAGLQLALLVAGLVPVLIAAAGLSRLRGFDADVDRRRRELAPRVRLLEGLRLFDGAEPAALERLAAAATEERASAGTVVIRQGAPPGDLLVLVEGRLAVDHEADGATRRVNEMAAPDYLGEIGLVEQIPRTATVTAETDAVLWRIPGQLFLNAVTSGPMLSPALAAGISSRLARTPSVRG